MIKRLGVSLLILMLMCTYTTKKNDRIHEAVIQDEKVVKMLTVTSEKLVRCTEDVFESALSQSKNDASETLVLENAPTLQNETLNSEKAILKSVQNKEQIQLSDQNQSIDQAEAASNVSNANGIKLPTKEAILVVSQEKLGDVNKRSYDEIVSGYYDKLDGIQKMSQESVEEMLEMARQEYLFTDEKTRSTLEFKREMVMKYYNLANQMEILIDKTVDETLVKLQKELESNDYTSSIVAQFKTEYEQQKEVTMREIMEHVFTKISLTN